MTHKGLQAETALNITDAGRGRHRSLPLRAVSSLQLCVYSVFLSCLVSVEP